MNRGYLATALLLCAPLTNAQTIIGPLNGVTGIQGLTFTSSGTVYTLNVAFVTDASYSTAYASPPLFGNNDATDANNAVSAIVAFLQRSNAAALTGGAKTFVVPDNPPNGGVVESVTGGEYASSGSPPTYYWSNFGGGSYALTGGTPTSTFSWVVLQTQGSSASPASSDGPLPLWAIGALGAGLVGIASRRLKKPFTRRLYSR
jgi:hypothetical protein